MAFTETPIDSDLAVLRVQDTSGLAAVASPALTEASTWKIAIYFLGCVYIRIALSPLQ